MIGLSTFSCDWPGFRPEHFWGAPIGVAGRYA